MSESQHTPHIPRDILVPETHHAYRAAHAVADAAYAASKIKDLGAEAVEIGFGPGVRIFEIANQIGDLIDEQPGSATPWQPGITQ